MPLNTTGVLFTRGCRVDNKACVALSPFVIIKSGGVNERESNRSRKAVILAVVSEGSDVCSR